MPEDGMLGSGEFHNILHKSSGSHQNPSRNYTDGSATSEAVLSALKAVNEGIVITMNNINTNSTQNRSSI